MSGLFKQCPYCKHKWKTRQDFIDDKNISLIGYQVFFEDLEKGLFLFNHKSCKTSLSLPFNAFADMYDGHIYEERKTGTKSCPEYCLNKYNLKSCPAECSCAYVRETIQKIKEHEQTRDL